MQIQINPDYRIKSEPRSVTVEARRVVQSGKHEGQEVWDVVGYYPTLERAYKDLLNYALNGSELDGVAAIMSYLGVIHGDIKRSLEGMK